MMSLPHRLTLGAIALGLLGGGCSAPKPARIFIDLAQAEKELAQPIASLPPTKGPQGLAGDTYELPGLPSQITLTDDSRSLSEEAWREVTASRDRLYQDLKSKLIRSYLAEVSGLRDERRKSLEESHAQRLDKAWEEIRGRFDRLSNEVGPMVHRLSWLSGFPDPDPASRRKSSSDQLRQAELNEAADLREKIKQLEGEYRQEVKALLASLQVERETSLNRLVEEEGRQDADLILQAEAEAKRRAAQALSAISETAFQPQGLLPAQPPVRVQQPSIKAQAGTNWSSSPRSPWPLRDRLKDEAIIYVRLKGGTLSPTRKGASDATKEFLEWRRSRE